MMREPPEKPISGFWAWLCRLAFRRAMRGRPTRTPPVGLPLMRDPDARCNVYEPRRRELGDFFDCQGDGHYLCRECCHYVGGEEAAD